MADLRIFVECTTKAVFDARLAKGDITSRHFVLIAGTNQLYHNGVFYGLSDEDAEKLAEVYGRKEFGSISDGTNTYAASRAEDTLNFRAEDNSGITVTASSNGLEIGSSVFSTTSDGVVPAADGTGETDKFLKGDGTWSLPTKSDVGLGNVDNESKATMFTNPAFTGTPIAPTAAQGTNTTQIATTAFVKTEIDSIIATADALVYKGTVSQSEGLPEIHTLGWVYIVAEAGTYAGETCEIGDMIICNKTVGAGGTPADSDWNVVQTNINGAVTGPSSAIDAHVAVFNGATGKVIADSGFTIGKSVPSDAEFTDTTYTFTSGTTGNFTVTPEGGTAQTISIGKPNTAGTADQVANEFSITLGAGGTAQTFDGSSDVSVTVTPSAIGAAEDDHTHTADEVTAMGTVSNPYSKPSSVTSAISTSDSLQVAIGKLEAMSDWVTYSTTE